MIQWLSDWFHLIMLRATLEQLAKHDTNYDLRHTLILRAAFHASEIGYRVGFEYDWGGKCGYQVTILIDLGKYRQVSWHMRENTIQYDGHTTERKLERLRHMSKTLKFPSK